LLLLFLTKYITYIFIHLSDSQCRYCEEDVLICREKDSLVIV
jgi:hypothetical protein